MANSDTGLLVQIGGMVGTAIAILTFWRTSSRDRAKLAERLVKVEGKARLALQEAAEANNEHDNLRDAMREMNRNIDEMINARSREYGEGLVAIRQHMVDHALWSRDNFVRKEDFNNAMQEIRSGQTRVEEKLDDLRDRLPGKRS
jgi:uncharacterized membrane protein